MKRVNKLLLDDSAPIASVGSFTDKRNYELFDAKGVIHEAPITSEHLKRAVYVRFQFFCWRYCICRLFP